MRDEKLCFAQSVWIGDRSNKPQHSANHARGFPSAIPSDGRGAVWSSNARMDSATDASKSQQSHQRIDAGRWECSPGSGGSYGRYVGSAGGRSSQGAPVFNQKVPPGGYLWWYVDALSDCGQFGITLIAFVGSVFSPYYAWARNKKSKPNDVDPENYCALNVALYHPTSSRWAMTERGARHVSRGSDFFKVGPSEIQWDGKVLSFHIDERCAPWPHRIRGTVRVHAEQLFTFAAPLDSNCQHMWGPIAPSARVEVQLNQPAQSWSGHGYLDSNEGLEPIDGAFQKWNWSRCRLSNGDTAVLYDVYSKQGVNKVLALIFSQAGDVKTFEVPSDFAMSPTFWRLNRSMRADGPSKVLQQLEDTPFYQRALLQTQLMGETAVAFHESLSIPRLVSPIVQAMLPFRMPRIS